MHAHRHAPATPVTPVVTVLEQLVVCVYTQTNSVLTYIHTFVLVFYQSQTSQQEATRLVVPLAVGTPPLYIHRNTHTHTHRHTHTGTHTHTHTHIHTP